MPIIPITSSDLYMFGLIITFPFFFTRVDPMGGGTGGTQLPPCGRALILGVYPPLGHTLKNKE